MKRRNRYSKMGLCLICLVLLLAGSVIGTGAVSPVAGSATGQAGSTQKVYVGGMPFGVKFYTEGILVVGFCDVDAPATAGTAGTSATARSAATHAVNPAKEAGLRERDVIVKINGEPPANATALTQAVEAAAGKPISLTVRRTEAEGSAARRTASRKTSELTLSVTPAFSVSENRYKTGMWVRDSGAGIGTVTFIIPGSRAFAGLGHGICDGDTGELVAMQRGQVTDVTVSGVERGEVGAPGAIKGYFAPGKTGTLLGNTSCGVFGVFSTLPSAATTQVPVGRRQDLKEGEATVLCTLDDGSVGSYTVQISGIDPTATGSKCFTIKVTDQNLIRKTGGIVQGMSGSPILQNGCLVGAVTHVLINDPTTGYGIFVDNMLRDMPDLLR